MCSKLYADGELAATPYETDKVLRHRELCMGLNVLYAKKNHDYGDSFHQTYIEEGMAMPRIRLGELTTLSMSRRSLNKRLAMRGASNAD